MGNIVDQLSRLSENDLRKKVLVPLLHALRSFRVEDCHGARENGIDVYFSYKHMMRDIRHCCLFIKTGNIRKSGKNDIRKMEGAIREAVATPFIEPCDFKKIFIEEFYFVCSGHLKRDAKEFLNNIFTRGSMPNLKIIDIDRMAELIEGVITDFNISSSSKYKFKVNTFARFCNDISPREEKFFGINDRKEGKVIES